MLFLKYEKDLKFAILHFVLIDGRNKLYEHMA